MITENIRAAMASIFKQGQVLEQVPMKLHTSMRVGGPAAFLALPENAGQIAAALDFCGKAGLDHYIIGNGTNMIVDDAGFDGLILKIGEAMGSIRSEGDMLTAGAGALLSSVSKFAAARGLSGMEFAAGIPGSIGGAVSMNAGAYGGEIADILLEAMCLDGSGKIMICNRDDMCFAYRDSIVQREQLIVLSATFRLRRGDSVAISRTMQELNRRRNEKQPVQWPSAGSVFKRPEGHYAGQLIEEAGLKGLTLGGARISPMHAGFIINEDQATSDDIRKLIELVKLAVFDKSGIMLHEEVKFLGGTA